MGNQRLLLYFTLFFITYMIWAQWQMDYGPKPIVATPEVINGEVNPMEGVPMAATSATGQKTVSAITNESESMGQRITVVTDVLEVEINTKGGDIRHALLRNYSIMQRNQKKN